MTYPKPRPLKGEDHLADFRCGDETLDEWLAKYAHLSQSTGSARVFVVTESLDSNVVVGYYSFSTGSVIRSHSNARVAKGMPDPVPIFLIGRLARHKDHSGLGGGLLRDAIARSVRLADDEIGARAIMVQAASEVARDWYLGFDFEPTLGDDMHLQLLMKDARAIVRNSRA